ncbi:hypothetical protein EDB85DRAFT_2164434 [Lactarius pseudohatsudake]|nr:hypothetical protein EDB85DRAFT_2164434 [Lactarius pseudohatsudake]
MSFVSVVPVSRRGPTQMRPPTRATSPQLQHHHTHLLPLDPAQHDRDTPSTPLTRLPPRHDRQCHFATTLLPAPPALTLLHQRCLDTASIATLDTGTAIATHLVQPTLPHPQGPPPPPRRRHHRYPPTPTPPRPHPTGAVSTRPPPLPDSTQWPPRRGRLVTTATTASAALLRRHLGTDPVAAFSPTTLALPLYGTPPPVPLYYTPADKLPTAGTIQRKSQAQGRRHANNLRQERWRGGAATPRLNDNGSNNGDNDGSDNGNDTSDNGNDTSDNCDDGSEDGDDETTDDSSGARTTQQVFRSHR